MTIQMVFGPESSPSLSLSLSLRASISRIEFQVLLFRTRFDKHCHLYRLSVGVVACPLCVLFCSPNLSLSSYKLIPSIAHIILGCVCTSSVRISRPMWPSYCLELVHVLSYSLLSYLILSAASCAMLRHSLGRLRRCESLHGVLARVLTPI
jgi:hypothetical protein